MKRESKYIFRRVVSGVLIALILTFIRGCDVNALSIQPTISNAYIYNAGTNQYTSISGTSINYGGTSWYQFNSINRYLIRIVYAVPSGVPTGYYDISFVTYNSVGNQFSGFIFSGNQNFSCWNSSNYSIDPNDGTTASDGSQVWLCPNVYIGALSSYNIYLNGTIQNSYSFLITTRWTLTPVDDSSSLETAIEEQTQQQHQDAQNTQNAINDVNNSLNDDNVDNQGSFFSGFDSGSTGSLMDLISLPIDFIDSLNNSCQPIQLPHLQMYSFDFQLTIPCMSTFVYNQFSTTIINTLKLIINGFLVYYMLKWFIGFIHDLKDPNNDDLEVMDL